MNPSANRASLPTPLEALGRHFGHPSFRPNQEEVIRALLAGRDVLAVMPTGAGKSVCFQIPALCLPGCTLVISPLIALMADQVQALRQAGIQAACLNSTLLPRDHGDILNRAAGGGCKLLYVAPERLQNPEFRRFCAECPPALVAIDEAHCVSQWGHNFRPDYVEIAPFLATLPKRPAVAAFTATATPAVREDTLRLLELRDPLVVVSSFDRPNLFFAVQRPKRKKEALLTLLREPKRAGQSGIVYCQTRKAVEDVHALLVENGIPAARYHAGLTNAERADNQADFVHDRRPVMVATNAFGMGIDKSNVSFVIHYNMPLDLEGYYQEAGRAGRDGEPADCILLYAGQDRATAEFLIKSSLDDRTDLAPDLKDNLLQRARARLSRMSFYATGAQCLRHIILDYFHESSPLSCGRCGNCLTEFVEEDVTVAAQKITSCVFRLQERGRRMGKGSIAAILRGSKDRKILGARLDTLSTYGIMADTTETRIRFILDALLEAGILTLNLGDYPVIEFTGRTMAFLKNRESFVISLPKEPPPETKTPKDGPDRGRFRASSDSASVEEGAELFNRLKALRGRIAAEQGVPAYIVFTNATLKDMCRKMPRTKRELLSVSGVGEVKAERFGESFLELIRAYEDAGGLPE